jgi:hypothetical protein
MPKVPRRQCVRPKSKGVSKDTQMGSKMRRKARLERTIERAQRELAGDDSDESDYEDVDTVTEGEKRAVVKFFWMTLGKPKRPSTWCIVVVVRTQCLPVGDPRRYDDGNPTQLSSAMRCTWADHPLPWRIVEDISRYSLVIDRIVECQGSVVPDHTAQHGGCSKHKRRETKEGAALASRVYRPSAQVAAITEARCTELHRKAKALCGE